MANTAPAHRATLQSLIIGGGFKDPKKVLKVTSETSTEMLHLRLTHQEADTMMILFIAEYYKNSYNRKIIRCFDTDVLILLLYYFHSPHIQEATEVFMHSGIGDKERFVPIHTIAKKLGTKICSIIPAIHVKSGCDTTSSIHSIGKNKAYSKMLQYSKHLQDLTNLGDNI